MSDEKNLPLSEPDCVAEMAGVFVVNTAHEGYRRAGFILCRGENTLPPVPVSVLTALKADPRLVVTVIAADIHSDTPGRLDNTGTFAAITEELEQQRLADEQHHQEAEAAKQARQAEELARQEAEAAEQARQAEELARQEAEAVEQARQAEELARQEAEAAEQARQAEELARQEAEAAELLRQASEQPSGKGRGKK